VLAEVLSSAGADSHSVLAEVDSGWPLKVLAEEHTDAVDRLQVFGVPTFIVGEQATFVRLMARPSGDAPLAISTVNRVLDLMSDWPELNEFKHTSLAS